MNTGLVIGMISCGVLTAVGRKVTESLGESLIASYIAVCGTSLTAIAAIGVVVNLLTTLKKMF